MNKLFKNHQNEIVLAISLCIYSLLKGITCLYSEYSTVILFVAVVILLFSNILHEIKTTGSVYIASGVYILVGIMLVMFSFDYLFRYNLYTVPYIKDFLIYGLPILYYSSKQIDIEAFAHILAALLALVFLVYCVDPIIGYPVFGDYMTFGYYCVLPAFVFSMFERMYFHKKKYAFIEILSFLNLLFFSNRGALLTGLVIFLLLRFYSNKKNAKLILFDLILVFAFIYIVSNSKEIAIRALEALQNAGIRSYSLKNFLFAITNSSFDITTGRGEITSWSIMEFDKSPIFGLGVGYFESIRGIFTHNLFLEIAVSYGILGLVFFTILLGIQVLYVFTSESQFNRIFGCVLMFLAITPLMFSMTLFIWQYFWLFLSFGFLSKKNFLDVTIR